MKQIRWHCSECGSNVLGPTKPRAMNTCRFCLDCSRTSVLMVRRIPVVLEKKREAKLARKQARLREQRERELEKKKAERAEKERIEAQRRERVRERKLEAIRNDYSVVVNGETRFVTDRVRDAIRRHKELSRGKEGEVKLIRISAAGTIFEGVPNFKGKITRWFCPDTGRYSFID